MKKLFSGIFAVIFAVAVAFPFVLFAGNTKSAFAQSNEHATIIPTELGLDGEEKVDVDCNAADKDNLSISDYVPYDYDGSIMSGKALWINGVVRDLEFVPTDSNTLDKSSNESMFLWIYLPDTNLSKIEITLSGENDISQSVSLAFDILASDLYTTEDDGLVPGWRYVEVFLSKATASDEVVLYRFLDKITIVGKDKDINPYYFGVYDVCLAECTYEAGAVAEYDGNCIVKQLNRYGYIAIDNNFIETNVTSNKLVGDRISVPAGGNVFSWAYIAGKKLFDLNGTIDAGTAYWGKDGEIHTLVADATYSVWMKVTKPSGASTYYEVLDSRRSSVGTFEEEGIYKLNFVVRAQVGDDLLDLVQSGDYSVEVFNNVDGIWFETTWTQISAGYVYRYYFRVDINYYRTSLNDIVVVSDDPKVIEIEKVVYEGGQTGYVELRAKKGGKANISLQARLTRKDGSSNKEETDLISIRVVSSDDNSSNVIKIVLIVALCLIVSGGLAYAIYAIVKHNRMQIK